MARGRFYHDPARKHIEQYQDFGGGLNTMTANENMQDNELSYLENIDLGDRGSLKRRKGFESKPMVYEDEGIAQGYWRFHRRYTPYNLIGIAGSFDEPIRYYKNGKERIGSWINFNLHESEHVYKIEREEAANLTVNPQFEDGSTGWRFNIPEDKGRARIWHNTDTEGAARVLYIEQYAGVKGYLGEYQEPIIPTMEGEEFYAEVMVRRPNYAGHPDAPRKAHLGAYFFGENLERRYYYIHSDFDIKVGWQKISGFFKAPKGATGVRFGVGLSDYTNRYVGCYFDLFHVRVKASRTDNGAAAITHENLPDHNKWGGIGYNFNIEPNKYYLLLVDYKTDGDNTRGGMEIQDRRYGLASRQRITWNDPAPEWTTKYMKFQTGQGFNEARVNLYNRTLPTEAGTTFYDSVRIYEITSEIYEKIDVDPLYTGENLVVQFPFRVGLLKTEVISEEIVAKGGKFYINGVEKRVEGDIPIQDDRIMEAVEFYDNLYIASGSGLLVYNGSKLAMVEPYVPTPLEQLYVGSNALEENPYEAHDTESEEISIHNIKFSHRYGVINEPITVSVGIAKPRSKNVEYKFERRRSTDKQDYWLTLQDWSDEYECTFSTDIAGEYQFKISIREKNKTAAVDVYLVPKYIIKPTNDEEDILVDATTLHQCNRILVHWDRLILYGDQIRPDVIYISDLQNPSYFPVNNTLWFHNPRKERITSIVRFRDNLVVFSPTSIQALYGTNPENYQRVVLNTSIGCIADRGAQVVKNHIIFPSYEGIALLKNVGTSETRANVDIIDTKISNLVELDESAVAYVRDNQYCIVFPHHRKQLRFYYEWGVWTIDKSPSLDFIDVIVESGKIYALGMDGRVIFDSDSYMDEGEIYQAVIKTKSFYFSEPYSPKKLRQTQLMFDEIEADTGIDIRVELDTGMFTEESIALDTSETVYKIATPGRGLMVDAMITHQEDKPFKLAGIGFVFKLKKP